MVEEKNELLRIEGLKVEYRTEEATFYAVNNISLELGVGETLGLVGETGAGKTTTALSIMKLLPPEDWFCSRQDLLQGRRYLRSFRAADAWNPRFLYLHDFPGSNDLPKSGYDGGRSNCRSTKNPWSGKCI